jgi:hypothetical protein
MREGLLDVVDRTATLMRSVQVLRILEVSVWVLTRMVFCRKELIFSPQRLSGTCEQHLPLAVQPFNPFIP